MRLGTTVLSVTRPGSKRRPVAVVPPATYTLISNPSVDEGDSMTVTVTTTNVLDSTVLYWSTSNITTTDPDFTATSGTTTIINNSGSFSVAAVADSTTEGAETFGITLRSGSQSGPIVASTTNKTINDTSQAPSYSASSASSINEGSALGVTVTTTNVSDGTTLYWTTNHTTTNAADFSSNSGSFTITNNSAVFNVPVVADSTTEGSETFTVEIRTTSTSGTIVATLPSVTVNDTSLDPAGWDLYFAEYKQRSANNTTNAGRGFTFAGNGTKVYVQKSTTLSSYTHQYSLATAWDISSSITSDGSWGSSRDFGMGVRWKSDGSRFYWFNADEDRIQQYTINSSSDYWDMFGTSTYNGETFFANSYETALTDIAFSGDGTKLFISGEAVDKIHAFSLSTAWDVLSTRTHLGSSSAFGFNLEKMDMKPDGTIFYLTSGTNIYQFEPTTAYDVTTIPTTPVHVLSTSGIDFLETPKNAYIKDGTQLFTYNTNGSLHEFDLTNNFKNPSSYSHTRFNTINYTSGSNATGVEFNPTGTIIYTIDSSSNKPLKQQTLSTAWDISTAGSATSTLNLYDSNGFTAPLEVRFKPDGTTMWVCDTFGNIREYPLSSPWTIPSSVTHTKQRDFGIRVFGFAWKPDGTVLYTIDGETDRIKQNALSTAWDITSTITLTQSIDLDLSTTANETINRSLAFSPDGLKVYFTGSNQDKVQMYNLSTAWDITSFSGPPDDYLDISSYDTIPHCLTFSPSGKYMYIAGSEGDGVDQFTVT